VLEPNADYKQWQIINTTTWQASDTLTVKNIVSYGEYKATGSNGTFGIDYLFPAVLTNAAGTINIPTGAFAGQGIGFAEVNAQNPDNTLADQSSFTEEFRLEGEMAEGRLQWQAGLYLELSSPNGFNMITTPSRLLCTNASALQCVDPIGELTGTPGGNITQQLFKAKYTDYGIYGQASFAVTEQLKFTAGLRYTSNKTEATGQDARYSFFPAFSAGCSDSGVVFVTPESCRLNVNVKSDAPTWLIGIDYKPIDAILLYAKYARGYRQGSTSILATPGFQTFGPEKVDTYEGGTKINWRGGAPGYFNLSGFYNDFTDQQLTVGAIKLPATVNSATLNVGKSRIYGFEVEAGISPVEGLKLSGSYAYLNAKITALEPITPVQGFLFVNPAMVGQTLPLTPKNKYSLTANYRLPVSDEVGRISIGATLTHEGSKSVNSSPRTRMPSYDLLNLNLNWDSIAGSPIDLSLFATNVTKKKYITYVNDNFARDGFVSHVLGLPRMYGARIRYNFGQ
jgi:iron complex outermembrane receptor protein